LPQAPTLIHSPLAYKQNLLDTYAVEEIIICHVLAIVLLLLFKFRLLEPLSIVVDVPISHIICPFLGFG
jgi:hypothetical protein